LFSNYKKLILPIVPIVIGIGIDNLPKAGRASHWSNYLEPHPEYSGQHNFFNAVRFAILISDPIFHLPVLRIEITQRAIQFL